MANELQYHADPSIDSGLTVLARVYDDAYTQIGSDVACAEVGANAVYIGDMPTASAGSYSVRFFDGSTLLGQGDLFWDGSSTINDLTINLKIDAVKLKTDILINADLTDVAKTVELVALATTQNVLVSESTVIQAINDLVITPTDISTLATIAQVNALNNAPATDLTGIALTTDITASQGVITTAIANKAVTPVTDLTGLNDITASEVVTAMQAVADDFKADSVTVDLSSIETKAQADTRQALLIAQHAITQTSIGNISGGYDDSALTAKVEAIPTNPLLTNDARVTNLDAPISGVSVDLTGIATSANVSASQAVIVQEIANKEVTASTDLTGIATSAELASNQTATTTAINEIPTATETANEIFNRELN